MFSRGTTTNKILCGLALAAGLSACATDETEIETATDNAPIIGGFPVKSAKFDAVGTLGFQFFPGYYSPFCTATLITPTVVLTAEHCIELIADPAQGAFLIGPDAWAPTRVVPLRGSVAEVSIGGGMIGLGADLAVVHLAEPVTNVTPLPFAQLSDAQINHRFVGIGYGQQDSLGTSGTRRAGSMTLNATGGRVFEAAFGSFEQFLLRGVPLLYAWANPSNPDDLAYLQAEYEFTRLVDGIEAWFGARTGDAQSCFGDSGGPITALNGTVSTVYGVTSWGYAGDDLCHLIGTGYASLNPVTLDFLDYEISCPLIARDGQCDGTTVVRCAGVEEGGRRELRTECSELGLICGLDDTGALGCIDDPCEGIPAEGICDGNTAVRCSLPDEGPRHVVTTDCSIAGDTCGFENGSVTCIGDETPVCSHDVCTVGDALPASCGTCEAQICAVDSYCCNNFWDSICVGEVASVCGLQCATVTDVDPADLARRQGR